MRLRVRSSGPAVTTAVAGLLLATPLAAAWGAPGQWTHNEDTCFGATPTITGSPDALVEGTPGADVILGGGDVKGGAGDDLICDATGTVYGGSGDDRIRMLDGGSARGGFGSDEFVSITVSATAEEPTLFGGPGDDIFWGGPLREIVQGGGGNDVARTGGGNDLVDLGEGDDDAYGGPGDDRFVGLGGDDFVDGGTGYDTAAGGLGRDRCLAVESRDSCARLS